MTGRNPWTRLRVKPLYDNRWIKVEEHDVLNPKGNPGIYGVVHFKNLAIGVLPIAADGTTWLVGQHRYPLDVYSWEIPEGGGPLADPPLASAERELIEETGLRARRWQEILRLHLSNSVSDELAIGYLAWELEQGESQPEETEELALRQVPVATAIRMAMEGEITDALSVATLLKAELLARTGALPDPLPRLILG